MIYFANPSTEQARDAMRTGRLGCIATPAQGYKMMAGVTWMGDSGCFGKGYPGDDGYLRWLEAQLPWQRWCVFVTAPDVVGDPAATLTRSLPMVEPITAMGYRVALVAQNGMEHLEVPWDRFGALFLGGTPHCRRCGYDHPVAGSGKRGGRSNEPQPCPHCNRLMSEWKLGPGARQLAAAAKARGLWLHVGRVNSLRRLMSISSMGADSGDGTWVAAGPALNVPRAVSAVRRVNDQGVLWEAVSGD